MPFLLHIKSILKAYIYNNRNNQIIWPVIFYLLLANLKVQGAIP